MTQTKNPWPRQLGAVILLAGLAAGAWYGYTYGWLSRWQAQGSGDTATSREYAGHGMALVLTTIPVYFQLGSEFMPPLYEGTLLYMPTTVPGISVAEAQQLMQTIAQEILSCHSGTCFRAGRSIPPRFIFPSRCWCPAWHGTFMPGGVGGKDWPSSSRLDWARLDR